MSRSERPGSFAGLNGNGRGSCVPANAGARPAMSIPSFGMASSVLRRGVKRIQVVEQRRAAREARLVVRVSSGDPGTELADPGRLLAAVLRVLHVDVVADLGDRPQRWIRQPEPLHEHL